MKFTGRDEPSLAAAAAAGRKPVVAESSYFHRATGDLCSNKRWLCSDELKLDAVLKNPQDEHVVSLVIVCFSFDSFFFFF